jgi:hypothetical protein
MSNQDSIKRFEELEAGRILGDLDAGETKEWQELSSELGHGSDLSLELAAASIETDFIQGQEIALPDDVAKLVRQGIPKFSSGKESNGSIIRPPVWQRLLSSPKAAWAVAAVFAALSVAGFLTDGPQPTKPVAYGSPELSSEEARDELLKNAGDLIESDFGGTEAYGGMSGKVVWSDDLQEGYMTLTNLPANSPDKNQYQLWIVDPSRDEKPVDGGVFDIPYGKGTAVIPIRNPLVVTKPGAFVITLEQPGGVVVSKQEVVVALASVS